MVEPLFYKAELSHIKPGDLLQLDGAEAKHAVSVRRMREGEAIQFTNGDGLRIRGYVSKVSASSLAAIVNECNQENAPSLQLTLVQALAKGDRDELAIQAATELGVMGIVPWEAERSISRWVGIKETKAVERWQAIVSEAAKQALRVFTPKVSSPIKGAQILKLTTEFDLVLVLDPTAPTSLTQVKIPTVARVALVVGPEGGISENELQTLQNAGAIRVQIGDSILRTSTAGIAAIAAINATTGQWASGAQSHSK